MDFTLDAEQTALRDAVRGLLKSYDAERRRQVVGEDPGYDEKMWGRLAEMGVLGLPFLQALTILGRVVSVSPEWAVVDVGLKSLGMDHGLPSIDDADVWFCSDEHTTFAAHHPVAVGDLVHVVPAHVDPTLALHEAMYLVDGTTVLERWPIDMRGW